MITALVRFKLPQPVSCEKARELFEGMAPKYREVPGLVRKYFLLTQDGESVGGVYLWNSQSDAEDLYTAEWKKSIEEKYGFAPTIDCYDSPVIVDNVAGEILTDD